MNYKYFFLAIIFMNEFKSKDLLIAIKTLNRFYVVLVCGNQSK